MASEIEMELPEALKRLLERRFGDGPWPRCMRIADLQTFAGIVHDFGNPDSVPVLIAQQTEHCFGCVKCSALNSAHTAAVITDEDAGDVS